VKSLGFCVKHERGEGIFSATNQILQIQRMFEKLEGILKKTKITKGYDQGC
jgi:hypothetical protein